MTQLAPAMAAAMSSRRFQLFILPTERCNFRCIYCYEDFKIGKMQPPVVQGVKRLLERRAKAGSDLVINWFGGEPLLALDIIESISGAAQDLVASTGVRYRGLATTNGYFLTDATLRRLVSWGVTDFQVSLDGDAEAHDRTRVLKGGYPTFDRIMDNIVGASRTDLSFAMLIRVHVTSENVEAVERLIDILEKVLDGDTRFSLLLKPVGRYGGENDASLPVLADDEEAGILRRLEARTRWLRATSPKGDDFAGYVCYAARANSLVVRANGSIAKCTVALNDERNAVGSLDENGMLDLRHDRLDQWLAPLATGDAAALACPYSAMFR